MKNQPKAGEIAQCNGCDREKKIVCRGMCSMCYQKIYKNEHPILPGKCAECGVVRIQKSRGLCYLCYAVPEIRSRHQMLTRGKKKADGHGVYVVTLCKPGDPVQEEIPLMRLASAKEARKICRIKNTEARLRNSRGRCFYFVGVESGDRLPWIDRMVNMMDMPGGRFIETIEDEKGGDE